MKSLLIILFLLFGFSPTIHSQVNDKDSIPAWAQTGQLKAEDVATVFLEFLQKKDSSKYLDLIIPLEGQQLIHERGLSKRKGLLDYHKAQIDSLEPRYKSFVGNFFIRSAYLDEIMIEDEGFNVKEASVDSILIEKLPANLFQGESFHGQNWNMVIVRMNYGEEKYYLEIPQIIELYGRWFMFYPEYYLRSQKVMDFVNEFRKKQP